MSRVPFDRFFLVQLEIPTSVTPSISFLGEDVGTRYGPGIPQKIALPDLVRESEAFGALERERESWLEKEEKRDDDYDKEEGEEEKEGDANRTTHGPGGRDESEKRRRIES